jgi:hypothetical protein
MNDMMKILKIIAASLLITTGFVHAEHIDNVDITTPYSNSNSYFLTKGTYIVAQGNLFTKETTEVGYFSVHMDHTNIRVSAYSKASGRYVSCSITKDSALWEIGKQALLVNASNGLYFNFHMKYQEQYCLSLSVGTSAY